MIKILVVEDESIIAADIARVVRSLGYQVVGPVASSEDALRLAVADNPALVLMDIRIRGARDGIETAALIRQRCNTPIVYLTSYSDETTFSRAKKTAPYGYILKPFETREIKIGIELALGKHALELEIAERDRWFSTTLQSIGDAVIAVDCDQRITFMNNVASSLTGWDTESAYGRPLGDVFRIVGGDGRVVDTPSAAASAAGFVATLPRDSRLVTRRDTEIEVDDSAAPILGEDGRLLGGVVVFRDVTQQRRLEQRVAQTERLASIGTLTAGIAHEINNPMVAVSAAFELGCEVVARLGEAQGAGAQEELARALRELAAILSHGADGARRVTRIVRDLRQFTVVREAANEVLDLPDVVEQAVSLTASSIRSSAALQLELGTTPFVLADEGRLVQVLTNLILNAVQAMSKPGPDHNWVRIVTRTDDDGRAVLEVRDNAGGIPSESLERIFDPFFTTKRVGHGMGLGLSIVHGIVQSVGGDITVQSEVGVGSVFRITLPPAPAPRRASRTIAVGHTTPELAAADCGPTRHRVLIIEDDPFVGNAVARVLASRYEVELEQDPRDAQRRLVAGDSFDVVLCDIVMPGLSGLQLFEIVCAARPELVDRFIFMSGGMRTEGDFDVLAELGVPLVRKPFAPSDIQGAVAGRIAPLVR